MGKAELVSKVHDAIGGGGTRKTAEAAFDAVVDAIKDALRDDGRVTIPDFGTFRVKERAARKGRNPQTGATIDVPASKTIAFKPAPSVKDAL